MIAGQGIGLPFPQPVTPGLPTNFAVQPQSNSIALAAGNVILVPAGWWYYDLGSFCCLQFLDPVTGMWQPTSVAATAIARTGIVNGDGANIRILNPKGVPVSGNVTGAGSGYVQSSTTITSNQGGSLWHGIIGGQISNTVTIGADPKGTTGGTNFTFAPTLVATAPPPMLTGLPSTATALGGVPATATCTVSAGAINSVTVVAQGAGYSTAPTWQVIPHPQDPTLGSITIPVLTSTLTGAGTLTAVVLDNPGTPQSSITLTVAGAGTSATATVNFGIATAASDTIILQSIGAWV